VARCRPIAGIHIDMFAPQTVRTMIGVTISFDELAALFANEIFDRAAKFFLLHGHCTTTEAEL
jgi:hypothetical protein